MADVADTDISDDAKNFTGFETIGIVLVSIGAFVTLTGLCGIFGVCCENRFFLVLVSTPLHVIET